MQLATITLLLGGDSGNTVQKYGVTPSEVAVLRIIHGDDAVTDIEPNGEVDRTSRSERQRLIDLYGRNQPNGQFAAPAVDALFPGVAARLFAGFDELEMDESFFKAETRVSTKTVTPVAPKARGRGKKAAEASAEPVTPEEPAEPADEDDGITDIMD